MGYIMQVKIKADKKGKLQNIVTKLNNWINMLWSSNPDISCIAYVTPGLSNG